MAVAMYALPSTHHAVQRCRPSRNLCAEARTTSFNSVKLIQIKLGSELEVELQKYCQLFTSHH